MAIENTTDEFIRYIGVRAELAQYFIHPNPQYPHEILEDKLFREEFSYEKWLEGELCKRPFFTGFDIVPQQTTFGEPIVVKGAKKLVGMRYNIYRFKKYNFEQVFL